VVSHQRFISANSHFLFQYAIRPSVRGNKKFSRDTIIKTVADVVGPEHPVDLKNYDLVILVDVVQVRPWNALADQILIRVIRKWMLLTVMMQNVVGMSVVGSDYDKLKRYNLAELYNPVSKAQES
jgi:tRNA acetyltransferase TAN1